MTPEQRIQQAGIRIPQPAKPAAMYQPVVVSGNLAFVSGQGPSVDNVHQYAGRVGEEVGMEQAVAAARLCAINALAALRAELGSLDRVNRIVKVLGFVASAPGFHQQPQVMNGASELLNQVFPQGHARSAIGTSQLPSNIPVEVELIAEISLPEHD